MASQNKYAGIEYRYVVLRWSLHDHAARMTKDRDNEHARLAKKYRKRADGLEQINPWYARHLHDAAAAMIYVPFNSDSAKFCKCCGEMHDKTNMAKTCQHIGDSSSANHAYYNCSCGSTLVILKSITNKAA